MKRRQILVAGALAAASTVAFAKGSNSTLGGGRIIPPGSVGVGCAVLPIEADQTLGPLWTNQIEVLKFIPSELTSGVARIDFDIQLTESGASARTVYAWQAQSTAGGALSAASGLRMQFEDSLAIGAMVSVLDRAGMVRKLTTALPRATLMVVATARRSTGLPPLLTDLRYDSEKRLLTLADGSRRDFEALLVRTS